MITYILNATMSMKEVVIVFHDADRIIDASDIRNSKLCAFKTSINRRFYLLSADVSDFYSIAYDTYYLAGISSDHKLLCSRILQVLKLLADAEVQVILLEDVLWGERPYINNIFSTKLFAQVDKMLSLFTECAMTCSVSSTKSLENCYGEGDCSIISINEFKEDVTIWNEVQQIPFHCMYHRGGAVPRLVAIQSLSNCDGGRPLYRHPNDEEPPNTEMDSVVRRIVTIVERATGLSGINHALIQCYRSGVDNIQQHSDKTLDIHLGTPILNVSFGATRDMFIQKKTNKSDIERISLVHGECLVFGLKTNTFWWHEVPKDVKLKSHPQFGTMRISFTLRRIATFVDADTGLIYGQGSPFKSLEAARRHHAALQAGIIETVVVAVSHSHGAACDDNGSLRVKTTITHQQHSAVATMDDANAVHINTGTGDELSTVFCHDTDETCGEKDFRLDGATVASLVDSSTIETTIHAAATSTEGSININNASVAPSTSFITISSGSDQSVASVAVVAAIPVGDDASSSVIHRSGMMSAAGSSSAREDLIFAFHLENKQSSEFDWNAVYGKGFLCR